MIRKEESGTTPRVSNLGSITLTCLALAFPAWWWRLAGYQPFNGLLQALILQQREEKLGEVPDLPKCAQPAPLLNQVGCKAKGNFSTHCITLCLRRLLFSVTPGRSRDVNGITKQWGGKNL